MKKLVTVLIVYVVMLSGSLAFSADREDLIDCKLNLNAQLEQNIRLQEENNMHRKNLLELERLNLEAEKAMMETEKYDKHTR